MCTVHTDEKCILKKAARGWRGGGENFFTRTEKEIIKKKYKWMGEIMTDGVRKRDRNTERWIDDSSR
jgi:hypothetical protein